MSDSSLYQLEDNVWDEFTESGDHIVPCPASDMDQCAGQNDNHKKPRHEVISVANENATKRSVNEESSLSNLMRNDTVSEKDPRCCKPGGNLPASCNSDNVKEVTNMTSYDTRMSDQGFESGINSGSEFCIDNAILNVGCAAVDANLNQYPPSHISQSENDFTLLNNDHGDEYNNNLFYDVWPGIGDFEDIDMFSDSAFGLGNLPTEEELSLFLSSDVDREFDATKSGLNGSTSESNELRTLSENHKASRPSIPSPSVTSADDSSMIRSTILQTTESDSGLSEQTNMHNKQVEHDHQSEGRMKDRCVENTGSFIHDDILDEFADLKHPLVDPVSHQFSSTRIQHQHSMDHSGLTFAQGSMPDMRLNFSHPSNQFPVYPTLLGQYENGGHPSPSAKSSYASNQKFSVDGAHASPHSFHAMSMKENEEKSYHRHSLQASSKRSSKHVNITSPTINYDQDRNQNQMLQSDGHSAVEAVGTCIQAGLDSKSTQNSSSTGSALNDTSLEAVSFNQLQQVMEKLDIRTKLCIRDGLYRLARSAEKRHSCDGCIKECREANGALVAQETDTCSGFVDLETNTNPIDRSIAHLLFHNPLDTSVMSGNGAASLKSHTMITAPVRGQALAAEKQVCQEETSSGTNKNFVNEVK